MDYRGLLDIVEFQSESHHRHSNRDYRPKRYANSGIESVELHLVKRTSAYTLSALALLANLEMILFLVLYDSEIHDRNSVIHAVVL